MASPAPITVNPLLHVVQRSEVGLLLTAVAAATLIRILVAGSQGNTSQPAALVFAGLLVAIAWRWRAPVPAFTWRSLVVGMGGTVVLVGVWLVHLPLTVGFSTPRLGLLEWTAAVVIVASAEELVFRGALFDRLRHSSLVLAVGVTSVGFGLIHVPLYGWSAFPLDVAAGVWLGGVRLEGGVAAAILTHVVADLCVGWLR